MGALIKLLIRSLRNTPVLRAVLRPLMRFLVGVIAIPVFRIFLRRVVRLQEMNEELEKDLEQWFRASLVLLASTANMEGSLFGWVDVLFGAGDAGNPQAVLENPLLLGFRLLLAIGVIEAMPDQELFSVIHPGPPKLRFTRKRPLRPQIREQMWPFCRGLLCQHLNRSSPVFAILAAIFQGGVGWACYLMAIVQYLIIGLVTSRDKALDVLSAFDRQVAIRRRQLIDEFHIGGEAGTAAGAQPAPVPVNPAGAATNAARSAESPASIVAKEGEAGYLSK